MNTRILGSLSLALLAALTAGCATIRRGAGFGDVEKLVSERGLARIHWKLGTAADAAVDERVKELLRADLAAESAVQIALLNNRNLQAFYQRLGIAQADLVQAGLLPNPIVHAGIRLGVAGPGPSAEASVLQDVISAIQIPLRKRIAGAAFEAAKLEVAQAVVNLAADVKSAFYRLQGAEQMLDLRRTVARATELSAETARRQREAGNITDLDLANEHALAAQAKLDLVRAEAETLAHREELNALLGLWGMDTRWTIGARLPELPREEVPARGLESLAVAQRLDLAAARQAVVVQARTLGLTRLYGLIPAGDLGADAEREPEGDWTVGPAFEVPIPIFDRRQAAVASGLAQLRQSQERYAALAVEIRSQVRRARSQMDAARSRADYHLNVLLPLRRRVIEQTQLQYNAMLAGVFQLLQAKRDEIETGRGYVETLTDYWVARAELERALGGDLRLPAESRSLAPSPAEPQPHPSGHQHGS